MNKLFIRSEYAKHILEHNGYQIFTPSTKVYGQVVDGVFIESKTEKGWLFTTTLSGRKIKKLFRVFTSSGNSDKTIKFK